MFRKKENKQKQNKTKSKKIQISIAGFVKRLNYGNRLACFDPVLELEKIISC